MKIGRERNYEKIKWLRKRSDARVKSGRQKENEMRMNKLRKKTQKGRKRSRLEAEEKIL